MKQTILIIASLLAMLSLFGEVPAEEAATTPVVTDSAGTLRNEAQEDSAKSNQTSNTGLAIDSKETKNVSPVTLTILGMLTVFAGLLIMQLFINGLKLLLNPPPKKEKEVTKEEEVNKGLLSNVGLTEDEIVATITAVMMESKLHHSISHEKLTLKWQDKNPHWISTRR